MRDYLLYNSDLIAYFLPLRPVQLTKQRVDYYKPGNKIPHCRLKARVPIGTADIPELCYQLSINGAKKPNVMVIEIEPQAMERPRYALRGVSLCIELILGF